MRELDHSPPDPDTSRGHAERPALETTGRARHDDDATTRWTLWLRWGLPCASCIFVLSIAYFAANDVIVPKRGDLDAVMSALGGSDGGSYVIGGRALLEGRLLSPANQWLVALWPPGMFVYFAALIRVASLGVPLPMVVAVTMAALWSVVLALWLIEIRERANAIVAVVVVALVAFGDIYRWWFFGSGLFFSEGLTAALFLLATLAFVRCMTTNGQTSLWLAGAAGALLALTAYVRIVFEVMGLMLTLVLVLVAVIAGATRLVGRLSASLARAALLLAIVVGAFHVLTVPWRLLAEAHVRPGDYSWTAADDLYWHHQWSPDWYLAEHGWYWLIDGEVNLACEIEPSRCNQVAAEELASASPYTGAGAHTEAEFKSMSMEVLYDHPLQWVGRKMGLVPRFWFTRPPGAGGPAGGLIAAISAASALALTALLIIRIRRTYLLTIWWLSMIIASLGPLLLMQFEVRYFYIVALTAPLLLAWSIGPMVRRHRPDINAECDDTM